MQRRSAIKILSTGLLADRAELVKGQLFQIAVSPASYRLQFFSPAQDELAIALTETIIPADDHSGGAREANVNLFIDLMVANSDGSNADPNQPSELVEFTTTGQFVAQYPIDANNGGAFGLNVTTIAPSIVRVAAVDDNANSLKIFTTLVQ